MSTTEPNQNTFNLEAALSGYQLSQAIMTLHRLGIPEYLQQHGAVPLSALANALDTNEKALWHLLEIAKKSNLLQQDESGSYALTDEGMRLCPDHAASAIPFLDHLLMGYPVWGELLHSVKTGDSAFQHVHGMEMYAYLAQHPEHNTYFNRFMAQTTTIWLTEASENYDFKGHLIDLGGNKGDFTALLLQKFPDLQATLFDLAQTTHQAPAVLNAAQVAERCQIITGSFFEPETLPVNGDIYMLSRVLLNWTDAQAVEILQNCKSRMPANAKLLILEFVVDETLDVDMFLASLNLLVMFGARGRSQAEFETLLSQAGFGAFRWIKVGDSHKNLFFLEAGIMP